MVRDSGMNMGQLACRAIASMWNVQDGQLREDSSCLRTVLDAQSHLNFTTLQAGENEAAGVQRGKAIYSRSHSKPALGQLRVIPRPGLSPL